MKRQHTAAPEPNAIAWQLTKSFTFGINWMNMQQHLDFITDLTPVSSIRAGRQNLPDITTNRFLGRPGMNPRQVGTTKDPMSAFSSNEFKTIIDKVTVQTIQQVRRILCRQWQRNGSNQRKCITLQRQMHRVSKQKNFTSIRCDRCRLLAVPAYGSQWQIGAGFRQWDACLPANQYIQRLRQYGMSRPCHQC